MLIDQKKTIYKNESLNKLYATDYTMFQVVI